MNITKDKKSHFWAAFIITFYFGLIFASDGIGFNTVSRGIFVGMSLGITATLVKDFVWDPLLKKGTFDYIDIIAGVIGSCAGGLLLSLLYLL